jgi:hypothetical protein
MLDVMEFQKEDSFQLRVIALPALKKRDLPEIYSGHMILHHQEYGPNSTQTRLRQALFSESVNRALYANDTSYHLSEGKWRLPDDLNQHRRTIFEAR